MRWKLICSPIAWSRPQIASLTRRRTSVAVAEARHSHRHSQATKLKLFKSEDLCLRSFHVPASLLAPTRLRTRLLTHATYQVGEQDATSGNGLAGRRS